MKNDVKSSIADILKQEKIEYVFGHSGGHIMHLFEAAKNAIADWTASLTKGDLLSLALRHKLLIAPVATMRDVTLSKQLAEREYFQPLHHPGRSGESDGRSRRFGIRFPRSGVHD